MQANERQRLRRFIKNSFSDDSLKNFCFDYFPQVSSEFTTGMTMSQMVRMLVESAERGGRIDDLHAALKRENRRAYDNAFSRGNTPTSSPPVQSFVRNPQQIFLSHASVDVDFAKKLASDLHKHGWQIWMAPESIRPGEKWVEAINRGLAESGAFVLVLTESAVKSRWVQTETNIAIEFEHRGELQFLPIRLEPVNASAVWQTYQWIPFEQDYERGLESLLAILQPEVMAKIRQSYRQMQQAVAQEDWQQVVALCEQIEKRYPAYRDTGDLVAQAKEYLIKQQQRFAAAERLYTQLQMALTAENWEQALTLAEQLEKTEPGYRDSFQLTAEARQGQRDQEAQKSLAAQQAEAAHLYAQLQTALTAENWKQAQGFAAQLNEIVPGYRDVAKLNKKAKQSQLAQENRERLAAQQAEAARLYPQLQAAVEAENWSRALTLVSEIEAHEPDYRDVSSLAEKARREHRALRWEQQPLLRGLRQLPPIAWAGVVGVVALVLLIAFWPNETVEAEVTSAQTQAAVVRATSTETPTVTVTATIELGGASGVTITPTTKLSTNTPVPTQTSTPTISLPATQTPNPNMPPADAELGDTWTRPIDGMVMVYVPSPDEPFVLESGVDAPTDGFWIDKYEVSNAQYQLCVDAGACDLSAYVDDEDFNGIDYPVVGVSAFDAEAYSVWVGGALPTEAQWEYAAVGDSGFDYPWGDQFDGSLLNYCDTNCFLSGARDTSVDDGYAWTAPVDNYPEGNSWVGAFNLSGNVREWVVTWFDGDNNTYDTLGGSWFWGAMFAQAPSRYAFDITSGDRIDDIGFRTIVEHP